MKRSKFLKKIFEKINSLNINYFVLGTYQDLPESTGNSDLDIVVEYGDSKRFFWLLYSLIKETNVNLVSFYTNYNTKFFRLLSNNWGLQIDVFYRGLCYNGVEYFPIRFFDNHIILHNNIRVAEAQYGYYVDFFKEILHNGISKEKYLDAFLMQVRDNKDECNAQIEFLYGQQTALIVMENLSKDVLKENFPLLQRHMQKKILRGNTFKRLKTFVNSFLRLFSLRPGYVIVVEGTDGSGKSFIIDSITPILNGAFHNGIIYNHLRPNWLPDLAVVLGKRKKSVPGDEIQVVDNPHAGKQSGFAMSLVRWGWYMLDYTFGYMKKVWLPIHSKSKVFIFDRYYYEFYLDQKRSHVKLPNWIVRLGEILLPKPDLILCLGGDPEKIYARKPETSLEEVTRQTNALMDFCKKRKNAVWIDTTMKPEESIDATMKAIMDVMGKRFKLEDIQ